MLVWLAGQLARSCRRAKPARPKMSLRRADYFKRKTIKAQKTQEETLAGGRQAWVCAQLPETLEMEGLSWDTASPETAARNTGAQTSEAAPVPLSPQAQQTFIHQTSAFPPPRELPSSPLKSQTPALNIIFSLAEGAT